ncbi:MAG: FAD-binding protein [Paludibacteraceae bacterium]|nr:FAD-binding protein [Paludibacteraceae bacterium]MBR0065600.1 FAD-binding protein [Paludibacteraceae bacterium]
MTTPKLHTDALHRMAYATDASAYREMPLAVAYPKTEDDLRALIDEARRRKTHLIPRAGGTSIAGQVVGSGIVVDVSRYMNRILSIDPERRIARVQPGVVRDELNIALRPYGLFFSPETSTSNRCCIGGMVGNNSCGTHSLVYGSTRHHVVGLRVMLADGTMHEVQCTKDGTMHKVQCTKDGCTRYEGAGASLMDAILAQLRGWQKDGQVMQAVREAFPDESIRRRSCGYAIDECLDVYGEGKDLNLPALITGSEGTLCFVTEITLSLDVLPPKEQMVVCVHLSGMDDSWRTNLIALGCQPTAVELIDGKIIDLARTNIEASKNLFFVDGTPAAVIVAEFRAATRAELDKQAEAFIEAMKQSGIPHTVTTVYDSDVSRVWALRKAGLGVLSAMSGDAKPVGVVEDTAVAPERMEDYMKDFRAMMAELGLDCVYYGHISTGELHLRPVLDLHKEHDRQLFRQVAERTAALVKKHHGCLSGEHGDGRLRGEFIPLMYGNEVYEMMRSLKHTWDPEGLFNMGKIVDTPPMDEYLRFDHQSPITNHQSDLLPLLEQCNGAGDCRKSAVIGGTMCPAYKATGDELFSTRARANVLREMIANSPDGIYSKEVKTVLDSCLACKACHSECPSNVDMTRLRSEILQERYSHSRVPFRTWLVAHMADIETLGGLVPGIYNFFAANRLTSSLIKKIVGFAAERHIPTLSRHSMQWLVNNHLSTFDFRPSTKKLYLFADEFTNRAEAELGLRFAQLLTRFGYHVVIPKHVESGRAAISKGCLKQASRYAKRNVELLKDLISADTPLVGIEPSCILSFRDEYPRLVPENLREEAKRLGKNCLLYDEFLMREVEAGRLSQEAFGELQGELWLHGHCHQKALVGIEKTASLLRLVKGLEVHVIPSGCCGMAGSFGYEAKHYEDSMRVANTTLVPALKKAQAANPSVYVVAPGTSCRTQIADTTGIHAYHPIEILYMAADGTRNNS